MAARLLREDLRRGSPAHAYLFSGHSPQEKGKAARLFAQALLCQNPSDGDPCNLCASCRFWENGGHPDYHFLQPEGSSLKIDQIRAWRSFFRYSPHLGRHQVFHLEQPELLTIPAANSLLKILEEPLPGTVFLLVTEDEGFLLPTVVSRCRVILFRGLREDGSSRKAQGDGGAGEKIAGVIRDGGPAQLLREARLLGNDRSAARELFRDLLAGFEQEYCTQRSGSFSPAVREAACLKLLLKGLRQLDDNASVPLVLAVTLYRVQQAAQGRAAPGSV